MAVTVTLSEEIEQFLRTIARDRGVSVERLIADAVTERWAVASRTPHLSAEESTLLLAIQNAFPREATVEWRHLCRLSDAGTITEAQRERLLELVEQRDIANAERLQALGRLARLRNVPVPELMASLGVQLE